MSVQGFTSASEGAASIGTSVTAAARGERGEGVTGLLFRSFFTVLGERGDGIGGVGGRLRGFSIPTCVQLPELSCVGMLSSKTMSSALSARLRLGVSASSGGGVSILWCSVTTGVRGRAEPAGGPAELAAVLS